MISFDIENITKGIGVVTATFALIGGGYTLYDKLGIPDPILTWAPEHFVVRGGPLNGEFKVIAAREKHRDDCKVEGFKLEIRDQDYIVHPAIPSVAKFSGPASDKIDKFGFTFIVEPQHHPHIAIGTARLTAQIDYECPEGEVLVTYPDHKNLDFEITASANVNVHHPLYGVEAPTKMDHKNHDQ
jgi:hypothetical protein